MPENRTACRSSSDSSIESVRLTAYARPLAVSLFRKGNGMLVSRILLALALVGFVGCVGTAPPVRTNSGAHPPQLADVIPPDQPFQRHMVDLDGLHLSILEAGTGGPIIFVHGVVTTSNIFPKYVGTYSPEFRGVAVDLRGYGDSEKPATGYSIPQFSTDLIKLADALQIKKAVWVGVSWVGGHTHP